jgi:Ca2+-binding EF-hand superfamily protein
MTDTLDRTREQKAMHCFDLWDSNGDDVLTEDEFLRVGHGVLDAFGASEDCSKGNAVMEGIRSVWARHLQGMDLAEDATISRGEYRLAVERNILGNRGVEAVVVPFWEAILDLADEDGSRAMRVEEFVRVLAAFGVPQEDAEDAFAGIDADRDGSITTDEWLEAVRQFWTSTDPAAPGNTLFGRW